VIYHRKKNENKHDTEGEARRRRKRQKEKKDGKKYGMKTEQGEKSVVRWGTARRAVE